MSAKRSTEAPDACSGATPGCQSPEDAAAALPAEADGVTRRQFATGLAVAAGAFATGCNKEIVDTFVKTNLREMSRAELREHLLKLEKNYSEKYGKQVEVRATPPVEGVKFAAGLDLSRCIGCRRCVYACVEENNQSRAAGEENDRNSPIHWIRVLEMDKGHGVNFEHANPYYNADEVPRDGHFYIPISCQQCDNPPCTKVCPAGATWSEPDGIVVIDYDWCIGCRYCMVACPYGARRFNWAEPNLPPDELNPKLHVLGNRPRPKGVVEKCTFCVQRTRAGRYPACVEVCPVGARKFGNVLDPKSEIRAVLERKRVFILKEELNTQPKFFYFYGTS